MTHFRAGPDRLAVLSFPNRWDQAIDGLTVAEQQIAGAVLRGMSNEQIASERGTSARTVANQIATIFRKLGVGSRGELASRVLKEA